MSVRFTAEVDAQSGDLCEECRYANYEFMWCDLFRVKSPGWERMQDKGGMKKNARCKAKMLKSLKRKA